jgi:hypothetical protein
LVVGDIISKGYFYEYIDFPSNTPLFLLARHPRLERYGERA